MGRETRLEIIEHSNLQKSFVVHSDSTGSPWFDSFTFLVVIWLVFFSGYYRWIALLIGGVWLKVRSSTVTSETLLAVKSLGLQLTTSRGLVLRLPLISTTKTYTLLRSTSNVFLPLNDIVDIVLNEVIYGWEIRYVLVIIKKPQPIKEGVVVEEKLIVAYQELMPRLPVLERAWRGVRSVLFDELDEEEEDLEKEQEDPRDTDPDPERGGDFEE